MQLNEAFLPFDTLPQALQPVAGQAWQRLSEALSQADNVADMTDQPLPSADWSSLSAERRVALTRVLAISSFAVDTLIRHPDWLATLDSGGELDATPVETTRFNCWPMRWTALTMKTPCSGPFVAFARPACWASYGETSTVRRGTPCGIPPVRCRSWPKSALRRRSAGSSSFMRRAGGCRRQRATQTPTFGGAGHG